MRRLYSYLFLILMLLNTIGYYEVLRVIERRHVAKAISMIVKNETEISGNLLLKIPMCPGDRADDLEYQRAVGEVTVDSQVYHYIKQKVHDDTLYIMCLSDAKATQVRNTISDYSRSFTDKDQKSNSSNKSLINSLTKFYTILGLESTITKTGWISKLNLTAFNNLYAFSSYATIFRPPCYILSGNA